MLGLAPKGEYWIFLTWDRNGRLFEGGAYFVLQNSSLETILSLFQMNKTCNAKQENVNMAFTGNQTLYVFGTHFSLLICPVVTKFFRNPCQRSRVFYIRQCNVLKLVIL